MKTWETVVNSNPYRIVLEKNTLDIFINGKLVDENVMEKNVQNVGCCYIDFCLQGEFVDGGTDTKFCLNETTFVLSIRTSGNKREGLLHTLTVNGIAVPELVE